MVDFLHILVIRSGDVEVSEAVLILEALHHLLPGLTHRSVGQFLSLPICLQVMLFRCEHLDLTVLMQSYHFMVGYLVTTVVFY